MHSADFVALLPVLMTGVASLIVLLLAAFCRRHKLIALTACLGLIVALLTLPLASTVVPRQVTPLLVVDRYAIFYGGLLLSASLIVAMLSYSYLEQREEQREEFYALLLFATLGALVLAAAAHGASFFLGLELLSVSLYTLIAYARQSRRPLEAGLKYLILSGTSSAFLLFGLALLYFQLGTLEFARMSPTLRALSEPGYQFEVSLVLILTGVGFKLALVPFHMWAPDVYEGAPAPVTAFVATVSKGAVFALLLRYFVEVDGYRYESVWLALSLIAAGSMVIGTFQALLQSNVKRILAYSSIAHLGFILVAFLASGSLVVEAVSFYLLAYFISTLGAFGVVAVLSGPDRDADTLQDYRGLFWRCPWFAAVFTVMLLSLAGIPVTAGYVGKFYVIAAGVQGALWLLVILLVTNSAIGLFYYLRIIVTMIAEPGKQQREVAASTSAEGSWTENLALAVLTIFLLWVGVYPNPFIHMVQIASGALL